MNCTNKEQDTCNVEKLGCQGCAYNSNTEILTELTVIENRLNQISRENNLKLDIDTINMGTIENGNYTKIIINAYKELQ